MTDASTTSRCGPSHALAGLAAALVSTLVLAGCGAGPGQDTGASGSSPLASPASPLPTTPDAPSDGLTELRAAALQGEGLFDVLSPWNTTAADRPVHPDSARLLRAAATAIEPAPGGRRQEVVVRSGLVLDVAERAVPVVSGGVPTLLRCRQSACGDGTDALTVPVPADVDPDPRYDGWFSIVDLDAGVVLDLWRARREADGSISHLFLRRWSLGGPGFSQPYVAGARGSGLPLVGGLVRPDELERGRVEHALAIGVPAMASTSFVQPASGTDGTGPATALPAGARVVLRADARLDPPVDPATGRRLPLTPTRARYARVLTQTLRTYGAIVVEQTPVPTLFVERASDPDRPAPLLGYELTGLSLDDFTVVDFDATPRFPFPPPTTPTDGPTTTPTDGGAS